LSVCRQARASGFNQRFALHLLNARVDDAADHLFDNRVFVAEITVNLPDAELRLAGDLRHAGGVKSAGAKAAARGGDDLVLALFLSFFSFLLIVGYRVKVRMIVLIIRFRCVLERLFIYILNEYFWIKKWRK
jgi:hypothetical protein